MTDIYTTDKKYSIIYADPPWRYQHKGCKGAAEKHYATMDMEGLIHLPIPRIADENCALFLWTTFPKLEEELPLFKAWGFTYKTLGFSWIKTNPKDGKPFFGIGYYAKSNCEVCLMGIKGKMKPVSNKVSSCIISPRREHSRKPDEVRERIVELFGDIPRIELFARESMSGWDCWGNETEKFNADLEHGRGQKALSRINPRTERRIKELLN